MTAQHIDHDPENDVLYGSLNVGDVDRSASLDDHRTIDYSSDGAVIGVEFLDASTGIDRSDMPFAETVERIIGASGQKFRIFA